MRKIPRLAIASVALTSTLLAGACSSSGSGGGGGGKGGSGGTINLSYWTENNGTPYEKAFNSQVTAFEKLHKNIKVTVRYVTTEFRPVIRNAFTANKPPDIFDEEGYTDIFDYVKEGGQVLDLTDWWNKPGNGSRFIKSTIPSVRYSDDKIYAIPQVVPTANSIFYNKKILAAHGIDPASLTTWDAYLAAFAKLKSAGVTPIAYGDSEGWEGSEWLYSFQSKLAGGDYMMQLSAGNCGYKWTDPANVKAAQMYIDLQKKGYFSAGAAGSDFNTGSAVFLAGKAAFYKMGNWFVPNVVGAPNAKDFGMSTFPNVAGGKGGQDSQLVAPQGFAVTKAAEAPARKAAALAFISYILQPENAGAINKTGYISAVKAANTAATLDPFSLQIVKQQIEPATQPYTFLEHATPLAVGEDALWKGGTGALTGQLTADSWMKSIQAAADSTKGQNSFKLKPSCSS